MRRSSMKVLAPIGTNPVTDSLLKMKALPVGQYFGRFYMKRAFRKPSRKPDRRVVTKLILSPLIWCSVALAAANFVWAGEANDKSN